MLTIKEKRVLKAILETLTAEEKMYFERLFILDRSELDGSRIKECAPFLQSFKEKLLHYDKLNNLELNKKFSEQIKTAVSRVKKDK